MADLFTPETREQRKARLYAAAKRWAKRLPKATGQDRKLAYELMIENLMGALRVGE